MRKLSLLFAILVFKLGFSQNLQDNNWIFTGPSFYGVNFSNPVSPNVNTFGYPSFLSSSISGNTDPNYYEGCASVSDLNGNLIMFSDGIRVWVKDQSSNNYRLVTNSLKGNSSSSQNVIFIAKPKNPNHYYIVTINGLTSQCMTCNDNKLGLYYSEIDISDLSHPVMNVLNKPLKYTVDPLDINATRIVNSNYQNISEAITSAPHKNNTDFWLIAHVQNEKEGYVLSYHVDCESIGGTLNTTSIIYPLMTDYDKYNTHIAHTLKISNDNNKIGLATRQGVHYGNFDFSTGNVVFKDFIPAKAYGLEFSSNSNLLYYTEEFTVTVLDLNTQATTSFNSIQNNQSALQISRYGDIFLNDTDLKYFINSNDINNVQLVTIYDDNYKSTGLPQRVHIKVNNELDIKAEDLYLTFDGCTLSSQHTSLVSPNTNLIILGYIAPQPTSGGIFIDTQTGDITVLSGTPEGSYTIQYQICETDKCPRCSNIGTIKIIVKNEKGNVPTFNFPNPVCSTNIPFNLPTTSSNGITGTWVPATVTQPGTYEFTPNPGQCALPVTVEITIANPIKPQFSTPAPLCAGSQFALPTTSLDGIDGTWSPAFNNQNTTNYTFTPNHDECAIPVTLTVVIIPNSSPIFDNVGPICQGDTLANLPTTSLNGISGTWSPALNNQQTTTYTFTPINGICALPVQMTIVVNPKLQPIFNLPTSVCIDSTPPTLPTISDNGITGVWNPNPVTTNTAGTFVYQFTPNVGQCASTYLYTLVVTPKTLPVFDPSWLHLCSDSVYPLPTTSLNGIVGTWNPAVATLANGTTYTFTPIPGQCALPLTVTIDFAPIIVPMFNLPDFVCYEEDPFILPNTSLNGITGYWVPPVVSNTYSGTYTFIANDPSPSNACAIDISINVTVNDFHLAIMDQYMDGTSAGVNSVGLMANGNYPSGTVYEWTLLYQDGSIGVFTSTTPLTYVYAAITNRIVSATVTATYGGCTKSYNDTWHCAIPHNDENGVAFCDCTGACPRVEMPSNNQNNIIVYPNPSKSLVYFEGNNTANCTISVYDSMGKLLIQNYSIENNLNIENLSAGFYNYVIYHNNEVKQRGKLIKE